MRNARQWGACWLACELYEQLKLDQFWAERLPPSRKGTRWDMILETLCVYRLMDPAVSGVYIEGVSDPFDLHASSARAFARSRAGPFAY